MAECPYSTPWGHADQRDKIADGIWKVGTPGHGGLWVSPERVAEMPKAFQKHGPWFEEVLDHNMVQVAFPAHFPESNIAECEKTLINWYPDEMRMSGYAFDDTASATLVERNFNEAHKNDYMVTTAYGACERLPMIPEGYVGVMAQIGGRANRNAESAAFLVKEEEYRQRGRLSFVIDTSRHQPLVGDPFTEVAPKMRIGSGGSLKL